MEKSFIENIARDLNAVIGTDDVWYEDCIVINDCSICPWGENIPYSERLCSK